MNNLVRNSFTRISALPLIGVLLYLIFVAGRWGLADVYSRPAINQLSEWRAGNRHLEDKDWDRHVENLRKATRLDPDNPEILQWLGLAVEGRYVSFAPNYPYAYDQRHEAADYYRKVVRLRPTWPYAWSELALVKYRLDEIDEEFYQSLHMAVEYGPWEAGVQNVISELGILLWNHLPETEQAFILAVMENGMKHPEKQRVRGLMNLIKDRRFLPVACAKFKDNQEFQKFCERN